jgi:hypothetical protein
MNLIARSALGFAVCAALGTAAHAFPRADYAAATKIYFGGATATDNVLESAFLSTAAGTGICDTVIGNIDIYRSTNQRVITCYVSNDNTPGHGFATRAAGGTRIAFHKESAGGSSNGVNPLLAVSKGQAHSLRWLDVGSLPDDCTVVNRAATPQLAAYVDHTACALVQTPVDTAGSATFDAHGGISDVEPKLSFPAPTASDVARLVSNPGVGIVFGVPVTTNLYRALQKAQFGNGSACDGSDATTCVPSLTRPQIRALYSQNIADWNDFKSSTGVALTSVAGVTAPTDEFVRICRRVATSGTQAGAETYFLGERCGGVPATFAAPDDSSTITDTVYSPNQFLAGSLVNAAPGSGDVRSCMLSANNNGFWGVGVLSTEVSDGNYNSGNGGFRFVAIDGAAPNLTNVANGDYDYYTENTINRIGSGSGALVNGDIRREVIEVVDERLGNTAGLASLNAGFDGRPWGNGGVLALASVSTTNTAPYSDAELTASPVNTQTRGGNNCAPSVMVKAQPVNGTPNP